MSVFQQNISGLWHLDIKASYSKEHLRDNNNNSSYLTTHYLPRVLKQPFKVSKTSNVQFLNENTETLEVSETFARSIVGGDQMAK